jgi:hypothetical protein
MKSFTSRRFREAYASLPEQVRQPARVRGRRRSECHFRDHERRAANATGGGARGFAPIGAGGMGEVFKGGIATLPKWPFRGHDRVSSISNRSLWDETTELHCLGYESFISQ